MLQYVMNRKNCIIYMLIFCFVTQIQSPKTIKNPATDVIQNEEFFSVLEHDSQNDAFPHTKLFREYDKKVQ